MIIKKTFYLSFILLFSLQSLFAISLKEQFQEIGYVEICDEAKDFDSLYAHFDEFIEFLQENPIWAKKLYTAKERFIRSKDRNHYSSDFFGFYDESKKDGRNQISFYYSTHFHEFISCQYKEFNQIPEIINFFEMCFKMQITYEKIFQEALYQVDSESSISTNCPSILFKVIKYLPSYNATRPHYDGSLFSLFLDSTDNESLLLSPYKSTFTVDDFSCASRKSSNSILLIPGALLADFSIYPTPHIVIKSGKVRYSAVAFAMRPDYISEEYEFTPLPSFMIE